MGPLSTAALVPLRTVLTALAASMAVLAAQEVEAASTSEAGEPRPSVILFIGDGLDDQWLSIARNYLAGSAGRLYMDGLPVRTAAHLQMMEFDRPTVPAFVPDSASSATAMATGHVTALGRVAVDAKGSAPLATLVQLAADRGFRTGVVTNTRLTDATPAAFLAHVPDRRCEIPETMERFCPGWRPDGAGGGSIVEQVARSPVDVLVGGGHRQFAARVSSSAEETVTARDVATDRGFAVINSLDALTALPYGQRAIALLGGDDLPAMWVGEPDGTASPVPDMDSYRELSAKQCVDNPLFEGVPTLAEMTSAAIDRLAGDRGFFLMVESGLIDKESHRRRTCGAIGEVRQLDEAVEVAEAFAERHGNTLLVVTSDHGQAAQLLAYPSYIIEYVEHFLREDHDGNSEFSPPGSVSVIRTKEDGLMAVNYGTNRAPLSEHTGAAVPVLMNGHGTGRVGALIDQKDIHGLVLEHLGIDPEAK